jgi:hypothetical protein
MSTGEDKQELLRKLLRKSLLITRWSVIRFSLICSIPLIRSGSVFVLSNSDVEHSTGEPALLVVNPNYSFNLEAIKALPELLSSLIRQSAQNKITLRSFYYMVSVAGGEMKH